MDSQAMLTAVEAAITALLTGGHSSYSIEGRTVTRLDLNSLFAERRALIEQVEWETPNRRFSLAKFGRTRR